MKANDNKGFWQRYARIYGPLMRISGRGFYKNLGAGIASRLTASDDVLELACGSGQLSFLLAGSCRSLTATDFSENMVAAARAKDKGRFPGLRFAVMDATAIAFPDASFDAVVIANALHIMPDHEPPCAKYAGC